MLKDSETPSARAPSRRADLAVVGRAHHAAEHEPAARELAPEAHVRRHVRVVGVHVEVRVLVVAVPHEERVVRVELGALDLEERGRERPQHGALDRARASAIVRERGGGGNMRACVVRE